MKTDYTELINQLKSAAISCPDEHKFEIGGLLYFAAAAIEELQSEVKRLKDCNDELREKQTKQIKNMTQFNSFIINDICLECEETII